MDFQFKLGKLDPKPLSGVGLISEYETKALPTPPNFVPVPAVSNWGILGNDQYGDCTIAGAGHLDMAWDIEVNESDPIPNTAETTKEYFNLTGGQDTGLAETDVLNHWLKTGLFGYEISAFAPLAYNTKLSLQQATAFYGSVYFGVQLPQSAQDQFTPGGVSTWSVVPGSPIEGGHCIVGVGYNAAGIQVITWGQVVTATWNWIAQYVEEAYVIIPKQFVQAGKGPILDLASLQADLKAV